MILCLCAAVTDLGGNGSQIDSSLIYCGDVVVDSRGFVITLSFYVPLFFCCKSLLFGANNRLIVENHVIFESCNFSNNATR